MAIMARKPDERPRVLGPYSHHGGWRVIVLNQPGASEGDREDGRRGYRHFAEREEADQWIANFNQKIASIVHTTENALEEWVKDMSDNGLSKRTIEGYEWAVNTFWPESKPLQGLTHEKCSARYAELRKGLSVDSHRNALKMCKTFLRWCMAQGWISKNPMEKIEGVGKRKKGKPQLRIDEARKFYACAKGQADAGDEGAIAALMCLLLTMRSESEALAVVARDLDDEGRLLWIDDSKTDAGKRVQEVPEDLRPPLLELARGKAPDAHLFRRRDRKWLWDEVKRLCKESGVPRVPPHGLRGMHATLARQAGATSHLVAAALGHSSISVTEAHYIDQTEAEKADRARAFQVITGGKR